MTLQRHMPLPSPRHRDESEIERRDTRRSWVRKRIRRPSRKFGSLGLCWTWRFVQRAVSGGGIGCCPSAFWGKHWRCCPKIEAQDRTATDFSKWTGKYHFAGAFANSLYLSSSERRGPSSTQEAVDARMHICIGDKSCSHRTSYVVSLCAYLPRSSAKSDFQRTYPRNHGQLSAAGVGEGTKGRGPGPSCP